MVAIFPDLCFWQCSLNLCSNLGGIDPEKLYRATLTKVKKTVAVTAQNVRIMLKSAPFFPFVFNPVASCALELSYQGMVLTVTTLILSGFIFD